MDPNAPTDPNRQPLTISELTRGIEAVLQSSFPAVWVVGEVTDLARPRSGHIYLTLKDDQAQIRAVIWRSDADRIQFPLEDGTEVVCAGQLDVYPPRGTYQLLIRKIEPRGEGAMQRALRELQARLTAEGLFDTPKKMLPRFPRHIAVVTSPSGAAIRDFLEVARRRWCGCQLIVVPCSVQGASATTELVAAIKQSERLTPRPDVVVVTRGGGSLEDLWCFNHERVVRAIHACPLPVISAIGHEIDVTLSDRVADLRALTPTEAAERVMPNESDIQQRLWTMASRLTSAARTRLEQRRHQVEALAQRRVIQAPLDRVHDLSRKLDELELRAGRAGRQHLRRQREYLSNLAARVEALNPLRVLARGYSYTQLEATREVVHAATQVVPGDRVVTTLASGRFVSTVDRVDETT